MKNVLNIGTISFTLILITLAFVTIRAKMDSTPITSLKDAKLHRLQDLNPNKKQGAPKKDINDETATILEQKIMAHYTTPQGVDIDSALSALGAAAGFGCQMAVREAFIKTGKVSEKDAFVVVEAIDGNTYYFGDFLNQPLLNTNQVSVWTLVAGGAMQAGAKTSDLPNVDEIAGRNARTLGTAAFGIPEVEAKHRPKELPIKLLQSHWAEIESTLRNRNVDPTFWGWVPAMAAQKLIIHSTEKIDPKTAVTLVMESAMPMSKIDPARVISATGSPGS